MVMGLNKVSFGSTKYEDPETIKLSRALAEKTAAPKTAQTEQPKDYMAQLSDQVLQTLVKDPATPPPKKFGDLISDVQSGVGESIGKGDILGTLAKGAEGLVKLAGTPEGMSIIGTFSGDPFLKKSIASQMRRQEEIDFKTQANTAGLEQDRLKNIMTFMGLSGKQASETPQQKQYFQITTGVKKNGGQIIDKEKWSALPESRRVSVVNPYTGAEEYYSNPENVQATKTMNTKDYYLSQTDKNSKYVDSSKEKVEVSSPIASFDASDGKIDKYLQIAEKENSDIKNSRNMFNELKKNSDMMRKHGLTPDPITGAIPFIGSKINEFTKSPTWKAWNSNVDVIVNKYRKEITGAQASYQELARLLKVFPNTGETDKETYLEKTAELMNAIQRAEADGLSFYRDQGYYVDGLWKNRLKSVGLDKDGKIITQAKSTPSGSEKSVANDTDVDAFLSGGQ